MCGIVGMVGAGAAGRQAEALESIAHRGPDGRGAVQLAVEGCPAFLGHTRLSIVELSEAGAQPMQSRCGRWWVVFNGELYNHLELRRDLPSPFRGHSDTETLVELLAHVPIERLLPRLNGMFAFAALDLQAGLLYLARDPFGIKPLYFGISGGQLAFSSELRGLKALGWDLGRVDLEGLQTFLALRYVPSPSTLWRDVRRLPPGHFLAWDLASRECSVASFGADRPESFTGTIHEALEAYQRHLRAAVERQLMSDVPVGVLLSGGVDSALVAAIAREGYPDLQAFTVGFEGAPDVCEVEPAAETARVLGIRHAAIRVSPIELLEALPAAARATEEPLGTTSILPMWHLVRRARADVPVVLTGQGSDEFWGGYRRYQGEQARGLFPAVVWRGAKRLGDTWKGAPEWVQRALRALPEADLACRFLGLHELFTAEERLALTGDPSAGDATNAFGRWIEETRPGARDTTDLLMRVDARMNLADDLLIYGDKIAMSCALEARVPLLDLDLARFVESLPTHYRVRLGRTKVLHKMAAERMLPEAIVHRRKLGFQMPFDELSRGSWRVHLEEILLDSSAPHFQVLRPKGVHACWERHLAAPEGRGRQVFALLTLALWWREHGMV